MTQQEKFEIIVAYRNGKSHVSNLGWLVSDDFDVDVILNSKNFISILREDLPKNVTELIKKLVVSCDYNNQLLAIELIYSELLKCGKLP